jgi:hypothetical protein
VQREFDSLENEILMLEEKKSELNEEINLSDGSNYKELETFSNELVKLEVDIETLTLRWMELSEKMD